jgi:hypothetical protein
MTAMSAKVDQDARILGSFFGEPERLTIAQMDAW